MKKIFYEKRGNRYYPVSEYDSDWRDSFIKGTHLVTCYPGGQSVAYNVNPAYAPMIAAGRVALDAISNAILKASELKPESTPLTEGQIKAWNLLIEELGDERFSLSWPSIRECAEVGVDAMEKEAEKLLTNPVVKKAYEQFLLVCELTKEDINV